ncbi:MAG TPA: Ku protein [Candidatus Polarisedimenticolaceae bacterium]|nr:Ku protein [Candidatus Polarisedimenticolaceae bacterium]
MAARAIWNGTLRAGSLTLPVQVFSAARDRGVAFHLLHAKDKTQVQQRMVHPETGEPVPKERIRRGVEVDPGVFVFVEPEEVEALSPPASRDLRIERFVPAGTVPAAAIDRPYWLGPHGEAERARYFALADALAGASREGIASWVMRKRQYRGVLRAEEGYLVLSTLRLGAMLVRTEDLEAPGGENVDARERTMATQLVAALQGPFDPSAFKDTYRARVEELIEAKAKGRRTTVRKFKPKKPAGQDLSQLLRASLKDATKKQKAG